MRNKDNWVASKYVYRKGKLIASRNPKEVSISSRLVVDLTARFYDTYIREYAKGKLLDLGCGKVPLFQAYRDFVTENICVDWENTLHKNEYLDYKCDLTRKLPFNDEEFNTIIVSDVLEHIPEPDLVWSEIVRLLAKKGMLLMNVPFYYWIHEQPCDYYRYTEFALRRFVKSVGLKLILLQPIGGAPEVLADILAKNLSCCFKLGALADLVQTFAELLLRTRVGKRLSQSTSQEFPLGYFLIAEK